jgi:hypothetical protein
MTPEQIQVLEAVTADVLSREPHPELFADTVAACYIELTRLRNAIGLATTIKGDIEMDSEHPIEMMQEVATYVSTLRAEVARLTAIINDYGAYMHKEAEQLSKPPKEREWCEDCALPASLERLTKERDDLKSGWEYENAQLMKARSEINATYQSIISERKAIAGAVIQATYDPVLADRIVAGEFEKEKRNEP